MFTAKEVSKSVPYAYLSAPNKLNSRILIVVPYYFTITIIAIDLPIHYLCKSYCLLGLFMVSKLYFASYNYFFSDLQSLLGKKFINM